MLEYWGLGVLLAVWRYFFDIDWDVRVKRRENGAKSQTGGRAVGTVLLVSILRFKSGNPYEGSFSANSATDKVRIRIHQAA